MLQELDLFLNALQDFPLCIVLSLNNFELLAYFFAFIYLTFARITIKSYDLSTESVSFLLFDCLLFILSEFVVFEARVSEFEKKSWQLRLRFHMPDFNDASHHSILSAAIPSELIRIYIPLVVILQLKNGRDPNNIVEGIAPLLFHYVDLILLEELSRIISDNLICVFHVLYVFVDHS